MIRDVALLRSRGEVIRPLAELDIAVDDWRAAMRRTARAEGMRIRTLVTSLHGVPVAVAVRTDIPAQASSPEQMTPIGAPLPTDSMVRQAAHNHLELASPRLTPEEALMRFREALWAPVEQD